MKTLLEWIKNLWDQILRAFGAKAVPQPQPQPPPQLSPVIGNYQFQNSGPNQPTVVSSTPGILSFKIPQGDGIHYLAFPCRIKLGGEVRVSFKVDGDPAVKFNAINSGVILPDVGSVGLYFQRTGDNMSGVGAFEFYRWFSYANRINLAADGQRYEITQAIDPSLWTSVFGKDGNGAGAYWQAALNDVCAVGLVFGGGGFAGHGVSATGDATMTITGLITA